MRITVNTLDGLGDFILRVPLLRALEEDGHSLQLLVKPPAPDLAELVFPSAQIHRVAQDPYRREVKRRGNPFAADFRAIARFRPDLYVAALFQLNFFDQVWIEQRFACQTAGFVCAEGFWSADTSCDPQDLAQFFHLKVPVAASLPELEKNRRMAGVLLGRDIALPPPRLAVREKDLEEARTLLARHDLREGAYWVACVGSRPGIIGKDWGEENWRHFFSTTARGESVVFLGNPRENASIMRLSEGRIGVSLSLAADPPSLALSLGLTALSRGYLGRDSGVMHLAASVGRPVLAVFGTGHWGRFLPAAETGIVVTQDAPCRSCDYCCAHEGNGCVTGISQEIMREAWTRFRDPARHGLEILEIPAPPEDALLAAREASRKYARLFQEFQRWQRDQERTVNCLDALGQRLRQFARRKIS